MMSFEEKYLMIFNATSKIHEALNLMNKDVSELEQALNRANAFQAEVEVNKGDVARLGYSPRDNIYLVLMTGDTLRWVNCNREYKIFAYPSLEKLVDAIVIRSEYILSQVPK
jgi:hypothetical protein